MASVSSPSASETAAAEGPVLSLMNKRLRALRKKYNRILQMEASLAQGKSLNKEQEEVLRSKPGVVALIEEYDKLRLPLAAAVQEELALSASCSSSGNPKLVPVATEDASLSTDSAVDGLVALLYFGCLFDVKPQSEFTSMMLTRTHERGCCLTYDYVTDEATELLGDKDLDMISTLGGLVTSRPLYSGISHRSALEGCIQHAKLWLLGARKPIVSGSSITYAGLREKLNKIMASDYYTTTPEMKAPVDVAAAVGKYNAACQMLVSEPSEQPAPDGQSNAVQVDYHQQEDEQEDIQATEVISDQSGSASELLKDVADDSGYAVGDDIALQQDQQILENLEEHNQIDYEQEDQQYISRRPYPNQRGGRGGRRGYSSGRGYNGRGGNGGNGYQNGRNHYYDPGYHPRSYYNTRGRGGRYGDSVNYKHQGASVHDNHDP
ncbi:LOW QUALITY PROTEIN: uncharacterized protein LOC110019616 [Phalaenopsis equestris]|uniref:LOW QUALITY PROTEIN: uncharacterized protein LOC110019616 n=1 Tax=Phalaenopsis equestris TaxID=78828 RepID=UPI0009E31A65|nr:LOW QUALITY PROTEIN: uncharacterized protein LOC110019616 [Phalaenopsis equestris]